MTLPGSGSISLGQVSTELGLSSTSTRSLNDASVRSLAGVPSGAISMSNLHGKSNTDYVPNTISWDDIYVDTPLSPVDAFNSAKTFSGINQTISIKYNVSVDRQGSGTLYIQKNAGPPVAININGIDQNVTTTISNDDTLNFYINFVGTTSAYWSSPVEVINFSDGGTILDTFYVDVYIT